MLIETANMNRKCNLKRLACDRRLIQGNFRNFSAFELRKAKSQMPVVELRARVVYLKITNFNESKNCQKGESTYFPSMWNEPARFSTVDNGQLEQSGRRLLEKKGNLLGYTKFPVPLHTVGSRDKARPRLQNKKIYAHLWPSLVDRNGYKNGIVSKRSKSHLPFSELTSPTHNVICPTITNPINVLCRFVMVD